MEQKKEHKRRGLIATIVYHVLLVLAFIFLGLTYQDPPPEEGIPINFGYEDDGSGTTSQSAPEQTAPTPQEVVDQQIDEVSTQDVEEAVNITEEKPKVNPTEKPVEKPKPVEEKPKPSNKLTDALNSTKNSEDAGKGEGEGVTEGGGDQGDRDGDINSPNREGGGSGNGNYNLNGRSAMHKEEPIYDCAEEGRVVVEVRVNRQGKTISAVPGANTATAKTNVASDCLFKRAKEAALKTTWSPKSSATEQQKGYIIYNFSKR